MISKIAIVIFSIIIIYGLIILLGCFDLGTDNADYILVLGHKLKNNKPDEVLKYRLRKTLKYLDSNQNTKVILSGGITSGNSISEASCMKEYLVKNGIDSNIITLEDRSIDTVENIENCLNYVNSNDKVTLISSNYHILRSKMICNLLGLKVKVIGCYTPIIDLLKHIPIEEVYIFIHYFRIKRKQDA